MEKLTQLLKNELTVELLMDIVQGVNSYDGSLDHLGFYEMDALDELFHGTSPTDLLRMTDDHFNVYDDYFICDSLGFINSYSHWDLADLMTDNFDEIIEQAIEHHLNGYLSLDNYIENEETLSVLRELEQQ